MTTRTYWLSFVDPEKTEGESFLGVCLIDVTFEDVHQVPGRFRLPDGGWLAAAVQKSWKVGCNPGGAVAGYDITPGGPNALPRDRLLSAADLDGFAAEHQHTFPKP